MEDKIEHHIQDEEAIDMAQEQKYDDFENMDTVVMKEFLEKVKGEVDDEGRTNGRKEERHT